MRKALIALCPVALVALLSLASHARADDPAIESDRAARSLLLDIAQAGQRLIAVGDRGHVLYSDDQGEHWQQARVPTRQMLTAVYFVDERHGWAVGHDARILFSDDAGASWRQQFEDQAREAPLLDVWFENTSRGYAIGAYGALLATEDGGEHWQDVSDRLDNPEQLHLNGIAAVSAAGLMIVGEQGSLFRSTDVGRSWQRVDSPYPGSWFGVVAARPARSLLVYGLRGRVYRSADFGDSWQPITVQDERAAAVSTLAGGVLSKEGAVLLVGHGGSVLRSEDDGHSFSVFNRPDRLALAAVAQRGDGALILVGQGGVHRSDARGAALVLP